MPELPEVETVRRVLAPQLGGRRIERMTVYHPDVLAHPAPAAFQRAAEGAAFLSADRRGKYLLFRLDTGATILVHLRMTGQLMVTPSAYPLLAHTHVVFRLDNGDELRYTDVRRFGRLWLLGEEETAAFTGLAKLGPEPFDPRCSAAYLRAALGARRLPIKAGLLDQTVVAGIGNIYADESLFAAGLHPRRPAASLQTAEWTRLSAAIPAVLQLAIDQNAMTAAEYLAGEGRTYRDAYFQVYGHEGDACPRCGTPIARIKVAGRSSCFCPHCQRE